MRATEPILMKSVAFGSESRPLLKPRCFEPISRPLADTSGQKVYQNTESIIVDEIILLIHRCTGDVA
jgi:hypothetical protein